MTARLLVVDDVLANGRLLEARLNAEYYEVTVINEARAVQAAAESWQPDVILLDVMMPGISGYDVCRMLKSRPATAHIPVIMVTALKGQTDRRLALSVGADEFLTKPVENEILLARLRSIIRLKQLLDEWRARGASANALGLLSSTMPDSVNAPGCALIVDDMSSRAIWMQGVLGRANITTVLVQHEADALKAVETGAFDLILVSLALMVGDPLRMIGKLKASAITRDTPMLLIAEPEQRDLLISGLDLGASDCISIPLDETELLLRASNHIRRKLYQDRLRSDVGNALELAVIDPLTQLLNRRYLTTYLDRLCSGAADHDFAVMMIDADHFKSINDRHGHAVGDSVLQAVAETLRTNLRKSDLISRYGGEEFVAVVSGVPDEQRATDIAEKLRAVIEKMQAVLNVSVTVSIGVAKAFPSASAGILLEQADRALYEAKRRGRNRVILYDETIAQESPVQSGACT